MPNEEYLTVSPRATIYEDMGTAVSVVGPVDMVIGQIGIDPSDLKSDCGVSLNYRRNNDYDTHLGGMFVISPNDERRLVRWLHDVDGRYVIETPERFSKSLAQAVARGTA